jgi:hypothetical protein
MKFTNTEDKEITQVRFPDPAEPIGLSTRRVDVGGVPIPGVSLKLLTKPLPTLNGFTLEAKGTRTLSFEYEAFDVTDAELSARITGVLEGQAISGRGTVDVKVASDVLIEFGVKLDSRTEGYISGQPVRAIGVLENVSEDARIGVIVYPTTEENAGNGNIFRDVGGRTPTSPQGFMLNPGDPPLAIGAVLETLEMPVASDAAASWEVFAWRHETDPDTGELVKIPIPSTQIKILDTEGYSNAVRVRLLPAETPVRAFDCGYRYFNCGLVVGLSNFAQSSYDFVRFGLSSIAGVREAMIRLCAWTFQMFGDVVSLLEGDEVAKARFYAEVAVDLEAAIEAGRFTFTEGSPVIDAVGASLDQTLRKWDKINRTGDLEQMEFELGRIAGENPDAAFEVVVAGIAARKALIRIQGTDNAIRAGLERAAAKSDLELPERLAAAERAGVPIPNSGAFRSGTKLSLAQIAKYWGASAEDMRNLFKIADAEKVTITFRSRSIEAIALIRNKISWPKPQWIKLKSTNDLDIKYLGYRKSRSGRVEIVEPPLDLDIDYSMPKDQLAAKAKSEAVAWVARNHAGLDPDTATKLANRLQLRMEEWPTALEKYINPAFNKTGKPLTRKTGPNRIERDIEIGFEYDAQGVDGSVAKNLNDKRTMRVTQIVDEAGIVRPDPTRRYFEVDMAGPDGSDFRSITGDIDFISILNLNGSFIGTSAADQAKRVRIYGYLQTLLGMQHGESFSFIYGGRAGHMKDVTEGVETAVTVSPGSQAHAAHFVENVSMTVDSARNAGKRAANPTGDWILMAGAPHSWIANRDLFSVIALNSLTETMRRFYNLPAFFLPGQLYRYINGLTEDGLSDLFNGDDGSALKPDGDGGVEQYQPSGSPSSSSARQLSANAAAVANSVESTGVGEWVPISLADALKLGPNPKKLELVPMTQLSEGADAGQKRVAVLEASRLGMSPSSPWFQPGDEVVIDPGEPNEERVKVSALGSLIFEQPLARSHSEGATVMLFRRQPGGNTGPTTTTTTTTLASSGPVTGNSVAPVIVPDPTSSVTTSPTTIPASSTAPSASTTTPPSPEGTGLIVNVPVAPAAIDVTVQANQPLAYTGDDVRLPMIIALMAILFGYLLRRRTKRTV